MCFSIIIIIIGDTQLERVCFSGVSIYHSTLSLSLSLSPSQPLDQDHDSTTNETPGVIILHPGSSTLRLGLSTQLSPTLITYRAWSQEQMTTPTSVLDIA